MPVGSCLGGQIDNNEEASNLEVIMTSSLLNQADQFAFMQQTLLMQIFRIHPISNNGGINNCNETGSVSSRDSNSSLCPTCIAFSDHCCQRDNGSLLFHEFIEANLHYCLWDQKLADALQSLRYQGYVCPGIMVMIANSTHLELMADLWRRQLLTTPRGSRISQVGLSSGCVVRPVPLAHSVSLHDVLCLILARLKQRGQVADMNTILDSVQQDWSSLVHRLQVDGSNDGGNHSSEDLRDKVHSALGALIKQRKVYYTGNKGYFLVGPAENHHSNNANQGCSSIFNATSPQAKLTSSIGSKFSQLRHSLRNNAERQSSSPKHHHPDTYNDNDSPDSSLLSNGKREGQNSPLATSTEAKSLSANESSNGEESSTSPNNSFLERSQSLRISKKSLKSLSSRAGGSLRLSKKEALALKQVKEEEDNELANANTDQPATPKSFERKNSFLSKLFSNGSPGSNPKKKPSAAVLATFSAQFPPPEIIQYEQAPQQIYQQLIPRAARQPFSNENTGSPQQPKIYEAGMPTYGYAMVNHRRPPPPENGLYSAPPPPLPYRPPPPNPYLQVDNAASDVYARILPKNPQQQFTISTTTMAAAASRPPLTPPLPLIPASSAASVSGSSPACSESETYARVSNLKKVNSAMSNGSSPQRNVRFADEQSSSSSGVTSTSSTSSSSGPSSIESQKNNVYDETLVVIEKSNKELEKKLRPAAANTTSHSNHRMVDTIHNNKNSLVQEVIYEVEVPMEVQNPKTKEENSIAPSYPSISDLTLTDISCFKSLTAQKMMAGLSFNSIDTLLEVNAAAEARSKLNESTETVDFGII